MEKLSLIEFSLSLIKNKTNYFKYYSNLIRNKFLNKYCLLDLKVYYFCKNAVFFESNNSL